MFGTFVRAVMPVVMLVRRLVQGRWWSETEVVSNARGPVVRMQSDDDLQRPVDGAGPLNHRLYRVDIAESKFSPDQLLQMFRVEPNWFSPTDFATFRSDPRTGPVALTKGDPVVVVLPGPWNGPVAVAEVEPRRVRLETLDGHMEAGWIEFRVEEADESPALISFVIESLARSGDAAFDALYHPLKIGRLVQSEMWVNVLEAAVALSGGVAVGTPTISTTIYQGADD